MRPARPAPRRAPWRLFAVTPSLLWFHSSLGLSLDCALWALGAGGLALSLAVACFAGRGPLRLGGGGLAAAMAALWLLLLSVCSMGQGFLNGAWWVARGFRAGCPVWWHNSGHRGRRSSAVPCPHGCPSRCFGGSRPSPGLALRAARISSGPVPHAAPTLARGREALLLEAGWAGIWLAAQPGDGAGAPPALLLLRWQLFKACALDASAKLRIACPEEDSLADCFLQVASGAVVPGRTSW